MLKNKSILLPKSDSDGIRVCVMNSLHPEYEFDIWLPSLSPSRQLIEDYIINQIINWSEFSQKYRAEQQLKNNQEILTLLINLIKDTHQNNRNVTLLCFEETSSGCHRQLIIEEIVKIDHSITQLISSI